MNLLLTTALIAISAPALAQEASPAPVIEAVSSDSFESIGDFSTAKPRTTAYLSDEWNASYAGDREHAYMRKLVSDCSKNGTTNWGCVQNRYKGALMMASGNNLPIDHEYHFNLGKALAAVAVIGAAAYVANQPDIYQSSVSYRDSSGRTQTVRCTAKVRPFSSSTSCN